MTELPLGKTTRYPDRYAPDTLCRIERADNRQRIGLRAPLPFSGIDIWNAWDLTWLDERGQPQSATAEFRIPADSPGIVESKSMKLYLGSLAMSEYASPDAVRDLIATDLGKCTGAAVSVRIDTLGATQGRGLQRLPGESLDLIRADCTEWQVNADLLRSDANIVVSEELYSDSLRSLCPVTGQRVAAALHRFLPPAPGFPRKLRRAHVRRHSRTLRRRETDRLCPLPAAWRNRYQSLPFEFRECAEEPPPLAAIACGRPLRS
jgi:NADPH-dependent 7-cyano-7-deazaguanine reductase QueF-like protein